MFQIHSFEKNIYELEAHNKAMQEAMVFDNPYTAYTMEVSLMFLNFSNM